MPAKAHVLRQKLLSWYGPHRRDFPWRRKPNLYRTLVAEFMLQQTRALQALPYYRRFVKRFPTLASLAKASNREVLKHWEGLGYYHRAHRLHELAKRFKGRRPRFEELDGQPGIGPYTLAALGSILYGRPLPVVDGNVKRVMARMLALKEPPDTATSLRSIRHHLDQWISPESPGEFNQALMELGATVCRPGVPNCAECPWKSHCAGRKTGHPESFPVRRATRSKPHRHIAAAIIRKGARILIAQRPATGLLPNLWEFPGGKQERGETLEECCAREIMEELELKIEVGPQVSRVRHAYSHYSVTLHFFECRVAGGRPRALGCQDFRWVTPREIGNYPFPRANWSLVSRLSGQTYPNRGNS